MEASLQSTVNMAQNCGSNNVNLLTPSGQFGTRRMGRQDAASPRYIFTKLEAIARTIFHPDDDELLNYLQDDGSNIEPRFYVPVIPMVLVDGADGIGTGWSHIREQLPIHGRSSRISDGRLLEDIVECFPASTALPVK
jgi:DNA topoisomerase-2